MSNLPELIVLRTEDLLAHLAEDDDLRDISAKDWIAQNMKRYHIVIPSYERMQNR